MVSDTRGPAQIMNCTMSSSSVRSVGVSRIFLISALVNGSGSSGSGKRTTMPSVGSCATFLRVRYRRNTCRSMLITSRMVLFFRVAANWSCTHSCRSICSLPQRGRMADSAAHSASSWRVCARRWCSAVPPA
ncbi:hypothetical protein FQZ97_1061440 [compost metagenome]